MTPSLPVTMETVVWQWERHVFYFPQISSMNNNFIRKRINRVIETTVQNLIKYQHEEQGFANFAQMIGMYEIKTNERSILSMSLSNYAIANHAAHGLTLMKSLTFDLKTGELKNLPDLFSPGSEYVTRLSHMIEQQIEERELPLLEPFEKISVNQDYYLADKACIIYFAIYDITPYYVGFPMFPISIYLLEDMIRENGLLERLLP